MEKSFLICVSAIATSMLVTIPAVSQEKRIRAATAAETAAVKESMEERLKDPDSAKYSDIVVSTKSDGNDIYVICGMVNAKNSYGGYSGKSWFYGALVKNPKQPPIVVILSVDSGDEQLAATACEEKLFG